MSSVSGENLSRTNGDGREDANKQANGNADKRKRTFGTIGNHHKRQGNRRGNSPKTAPMVLSRRIVCNSKKNGVEPRSCSPIKALTLDFSSPAKRRKHKKDSD
mmetsp:Transcript_11722/g.27537  ORF Transcript_11722/g.27537 Transcript_11722/m.27537 type:complete len:103 (+) Transcript_11722:302-610(+)